MFSIVACCIVSVTTFNLWNSISSFRKKNWLDSMKEWCAEFLDMLLLIEYSWMIQFFLWYWMRFIDYCETFEIGSKTQLRQSITTHIQYSMESLFYSIFARLPTSLVTNNVGTKGFRMLSCSREIFYILGGCDSFLLFCSKLRLVGFYSFFFGRKSKRINRENSLASCTFFRRKSLLRINISHFSAILCNFYR